MLYHTLLLAFLFSIFYGFFESFIFLLSEKYIQKKLLRKYNIDLAMAELFIGGLCASLSFMGATSISRYFRYNMSNNDNIFIDGIGILLGTMLVIFIYWKFDIHINLENNLKNNLKNN